MAKNHFLAVLSHELCTPLTPVLASVSMLQRDLASAEAVHPVEPLGQSHAVAGDDPSQRGAGGPAHRRPAGRDAHRPRQGGAGQPAGGAVHHPPAGGGGVPPDIEKRHCISSIGLNDGASWFTPTPPACSRCSGTCSRTRSSSRRTVADQRSLLRREKGDVIVDVNDNGAGIDPNRCRGSSTPSSRRSRDHPAVRRPGPGADDQQGAGRDARRHDRRPQRGQGQGCNVHGPIAASLKRPCRW